MPSQATPLPIVPAAQVAKPARDANPSQAAEGFEALVNDAARGRSGASQAPEAGPDSADAGSGADAVVLDGDGESLVAAIPVQPDARPATGSVLDALDAQSLEAITAKPTAQDSEVPAANSPTQPADPVNSAPTPTMPDVAATTGAKPEPATAAIGPATPPEADAAAPPPVAESGTETDTGNSLAVAREARIAEAVLRNSDTPPPARTQPQAPAKTAPALVQPTVEAEPDAAAPKPADLSAQAETVTSDGEPVETDSLAPLREGRPASERTPGELIRNDARAARDGAGIGTDAVKADAKSGAAEAKSAAVDVKPAPQPVPQVQTPQLSATQNPSTPPPPLELLLAQMGPAQLTEAPVGDVLIDPALSKTDAIFDPAAARADARTEIRTASTLQFAQGPRLTPQSAQTLAAQIAQRFNEGSRVFDIRMDPPELGRVEVRLEVGKDNSVRAVLAAERTETLAELQRSARDLERALAEAGLEVGEDALSFSLTDDRAFSDDARGEAGPETPIFMNSEPGLDALSAPIGPISTYGFLLTRAEGLDVSV